MTDKTSLQVLVDGLDADEALQFEACLTDPTESGTEVAQIVDRSAALLSEIQDTAYTLIVSGYALEYLASVITRIRHTFAKCTVFDFRNNTLAVSQHPNTGEFAGKCIVIGPEGEVTISEDQDRTQLFDALKSVIGGDS